MLYCAGGGDDPLIQALTANNGKILGQGHPGAVTAAVYTLPAGKTANVLNVLVCNTDASAHTFRIFVSAVGTYDATTALFFDAPIDTKETKLIELYLPLTVASSAIAAESDSSTVTFTITGTEV